MAAELPKFAPINEGPLMMTELKSQFYLFTTKKTVALAYGFIFVFFAVSIFLAFTPSPNSSSPWFSNIFSTTATIGSTSVGSYNESYGSHLASIFTHLSPNSSHFTNISASGSSSPTAIDGSRNRNFSGESNSNNSSPFVNNSAELSDKAGDLEQNHTQILAPEDIKVDTLNATPKSSFPQVNYTSSDVKSEQNSEELYSKGEVFKADRSTANSSSKSVSSGIISNRTIEEKGAVKNLTSSLARRKSNGTNSGTTSVKQGRDDWMKSLVNCNLFDGKWVKDESYPLYKPGSCSLIDEQFNCFLNGRPDSGYQNLRWKPNGCTLPRLDGGQMLELLRGKRLVFVGDSLNRNMWESLICILRNSAKDQRKVYEASGRIYFRTEASYSFVFEDYKFTVEFFASPFLVREWEFQSKDGTKKETLRLDLVGQSADKYKDADIIIFNTGHWWTHEKTSLGKDYYQEGSHVYSELNVLEAFRKAITTWARWVDANIDPKRSLVFFRGYSASHFSGGQWNSGGQCDHETEPIKNETYLSEHPSKMIVLEKVLRNMKTPVSYLNITRMSDYRKDGHPSMYRKLHLSEEERRSPLSFQDCSHWCLPGVPDAWNEILYAVLLLKQYQK